MRYKVEFAGTNLHEIVQISRVNTSILPTRENFSRNTTSYNGSIYAGFKYEERIISIDIGIPATSRKNYAEVAQELAYALDVKSPSKLKINESDIIYYAVVDGSTDVSKLFQTGKATINFICHDPLGYQENYSSLVMENRTKTFKFLDMGTYNSYPIIGCKFSKPSTFVYLANENSEALMVGSPRDNTVGSVTYNPTIVDDNCTNSSTFTAGGNVTVANNRVVDGNYGVNNNGNSIVATNYGTDVQDKWVGPTFRKNLDTNLEEFEVRVNLSFSSRGENFEALDTKDLVRVIRKSGTYMYASEISTDTIVQLIPYGTDLRIVQMGGRTNCKVTYNNKSGWISTNDIGRIKVNTKTSTSNLSRNLIADTQMGLMEAMGYDENGQLLFRFHMRDNNQYFEHNIPEVYIKDKLYLGSNTKTPIPNTVTEKDDEGKPTGEVEIPSGAFGSWNDFIGTFAIRRKKLSNGKYRWWARISRTEIGTDISQEINMGGGIINDDLPTGKLNHIVFYIAKYNDVQPVSVMYVNHVTVIDISDDDKTKEEVNYEIFKTGDFLEIDFEKCTVTLNGENFIHELDIGSKFFNINKNSSIIIKSDDDKIGAGCSYRKRYI